MAADASGQRLAQRPVLEVAQETGGFRHPDVLALYDLRMTAGAPQLLPATQFPQVLRMVELNTLDQRLALERACRVAPGAGAGRVLDLRPRLGSVPAGDVLHHLIGG